jgi:hypothetical protein
VTNVMMAAPMIASTIQYRQSVVSARVVPP